MKQILFIASLILISQLVFSQADDCKCYEEFGFTNAKKPSLVIEFNNGINLSVCGHLEENVSDSEIIISEFAVFNCKTEKSLIFFGALQTCTVIVKKDTLIIEEMIDLPAGENWKNEKVKITRRKIYPQSDSLIMSPPVGIYEETLIDQERIAQFFNELEKLKEKGYTKESEVIIMKLALLSLNGNKKARDILFNYSSYTGFIIDGASSEAWNEYTSILNYLKK